MVNTRYHHPVEQDKILIGGNEQYESAMESITPFKKFIVETYEELENYSDEELAAVGIKAPDRDALTEKRKGSYEMRINGALFHLGIWQYNLGLRVNATQWGELDTAIGRLTGGAISASMRVLDFEAYDGVVGRQTYEHHFSFGFEDTDIERKSVGTYLEACLPHPRGKVVYDEQKGQYSVVYKSKEEEPKRLPADGTVYEEFCNEDGTPYMSKPFVSTTYTSFENAIQEVGEKTANFQNSWTNAISLLRENNQNLQSDMSQSTGKLR